MDIKLLKNKPLWISNYLQINHNGYQITQRNKRIPHKGLGSQRDLNLQFFQWKLFEPN